MLFLHKKSLTKRQNILILAATFLLAKGGDAQRELTKDGCCQRLLHFCGPSRKWPPFGQNSFVNLSFRVKRSPCIADSCCLGRLFDKKLNRLVPEKWGLLSFWCAITHRSGIFLAGLPCAG